jgi:hypothetical protein
MSSTSKMNVSAMMKRFAQGVQSQIFSITSEEDAKTVLNMIEASFDDIYRLKKGSFSSEDLNLMRTTLSNLMMQMDTAIKTKGIIPSQEMKDKLNLNRARVKFSDRKVAFSVPTITPIETAAAASSSAPMVAAGFSIPGESKVSMKDFDVMQGLKMYPGTEDCVEEENQEDADRQTLLLLVDDSELAQEYANFGKFNSHVYRAKFLTLAKKHKLTKDEFYHIVKLFTCIKNKKNVLKGLKRFSDRQWHPKVLAFVEKVVHRLNTDDPEKFADIHIPSCVPGLAAYCFMNLHRGVDMTVDKFLHNLWAAQLNLDASLQKKQKDWEENIFWKEDGGIVKKAKEKGFNEEYYETKAGDSYSLMYMNKGAQELFNQGAKITERMLMDYFHLPCFK